MKWVANITEVQPRRTWKFTVSHSTSSSPDEGGETTVLSFADVLDLWADAGDIDGDAERAEGDDFVQWFCQLLAEQRLCAFRFETPPVTQNGIDREFEFVLVDCPALGSVSADVSPFAEPLAMGNEADSVIAFPNLRGDAWMIVPRPQTDESCYAHLAVFLRRAPREQKRKLWRTVAAALRARLSDQPVWLSTAGLGVSWLHVRLDSRPKYYSHRPYAVAIG